MNKKETTKKEQRAICDIAKEIKSLWKVPHYGAVPYLNAMERLEKISDNFGLDDGFSIISYFLSNAVTWRGEDARRIKKELNEILKS